MEGQELPYVLVDCIGERLGVYEDHVGFLKKRFHLITMKEYLENKTVLSKKIRAIYMWYHKPAINEELLQSLPNLKVVASSGVGIDHLDLKLLSSYGVKVSNTPFIVSTDTADMGMALLLASSRRLVEGHEMAVSPDTEYFPADWLGVEVSGATLGIVGMGTIGYKVAERAKAFEMKILYHNRNQRKKEEESAVGAVYCKKIDDLLQQADFVLLAVNLTPQTHKLIGKRELELMKPTATLINISRGLVVDQDALVEALQNKVIKAAALDVTYPEPLPRDHPLLKLKNVIITPHIGSATKKTRWVMMEEMAESIEAGLAGLPVPRELYKPTKLDFLMKNDLTKTRKEENVRCRVLNSLIHKAVLEMATTCEVSQEFYDLKLEICKVSLSSTFSACRVYWNPASTVEKESYVERVLRKSAPRIRYLLNSQQIVGNVPPVVFIKDKEAAAVKEVEDLLAIADFGPPEEEETSQNDSSKLFPSTTQSSDSPLRPNLFGIDHELLNKQIMDYKKMKVSRHTENIAWTEKQQQQLSKIQKKMKKKKARDPPDDDDVTPQKHLLDRYEADYWDDNTESTSDYELQDELQEEVNELEVDDDKTSSQSTGKLK